MPNGTNYALTLSGAEQTPEAARSSKLRWLYSLKGVIAVVSLYSLVHIVARLIASGNLGEDDPLDAILAQTLQLGYIPGQLPLYDWLIWLLIQALGPGVLPFQLLKYALLTATCGFIFLAARRVMNGDAFWAFLSVEALALVYQISWRFHEGFTHAVGAMCAVAAAFWALSRLLERKRLGDFALLGVILGLGALTVTTFWAFMAALLIAACLQNASRRAILQPALVLTFACAAMIVTPHFIWQAGTHEGISALMPKFAADGVEQHIYNALSGIRRAFTEPVMYLAPLIFLYPVVFTGMVTCVRRTAVLRPNSADEPDLEQMLLHLTLICVGFLIVAAIIFGTYRYPVHALMPLFLITTIWLTAQARRTAPSNAKLRRFVMLALSIAVFAFFARAANMYVLQPVCAICRWGIPYAELAARMKEQGFQRGLIIVKDDDLGGNLRRFFPESRIALAGKVTYEPPASTQADQTALVWAADEPEAQAAADFAKLMPSIDAGSLTGATTISIAWRGFFWVPYSNPSSSWRALIVPHQAR